MSSTNCWAIVVAGGSGARFGGDVPKQYAALAGRRILDWSLAAMHEATGGNVVLVVPADRVEAPEPLVAAVVAGGATRAQSVRCGLAVVPSSAQVVLVHDAARPCVPSAVVQHLLQSLANGDACAIPGVSVPDTVKRVLDGKVVETLPRAELVAVQTPQAFQASVLRSVHADGGEATDDAALVEAAGLGVRIVPGSALLRKVTQADDIAVIERLLAASHDELLGVQRTAS